MQHLTSNAALKWQHVSLRQCPLLRPSYQVTSFVVEHSTSEEFEEDTITTIDGKTTSFLSDRRMDNGTTLTMFEADVTGLEVRLHSREQQWDAIDQTMATMKKFNSQTKHTEWKSTRLMVSYEQTTDYSRTVIFL